jgi:hypothetical protein
LPAYVEIMLAGGDIDAAREACGELQEIAARYGTDMPRAMVAQACGALELAAGDAGGALVRLREAFQAWQELDAPYERAGRSATKTGLSSSWTRLGVCSSSSARRRLLQRWTRSRRAASLKRRIA